MVPSRVCAVAVLVCAVGSVGASAQPFVVSATDGNHLFLREYFLSGNRLKTVRSNVIALTTAGVEQTVGHALIVRDRGTFVDAYYGVCIPEAATGDCASRPTLSMKRMGSNLKLLSGRDFPIAVEFSVAAETLGTRSSASSRLLLQDGEFIEERELDPDGVPGPALFREISRFNSPSKDGRVVAAAYDFSVHLQRFHPRGPIISDGVGPQSSLSLSGPFKGYPPYRFLFSRISSSGHSQVFVFKISGATLGFIWDFTTGDDVTFTESKTDPGSTYPRQSVVVAPGANVVLYTEWDTSCGKWLLRGQVFDPRAGTKVGKAQSLIRCSELQASSSGIRDIDVAELSP